MRRQPSPTRPGGPGALSRDAGALTHTASGERARRCSPRSLSPAGGERVGATLPAIAGAFGLCGPTVTSMGRFERASSGTTSRRMAATQRGEYIGVIVSRRASTACITARRERRYGAFSTEEALSMYRRRFRDKVNTTKKRPKCILHGSIRHPTAGTYELRHRIAFISSVLPACKATESVPSPETLPSTRTPGSEECGRTRSHPGRGCSRR